MKSEGISNRNAGGSAILRRLGWTTTLAATGVAMALLAARAASAAIEWNGCPTNAAYDTLEEVPAPPDVTAVDDGGKLLPLTFVEESQAGTAPCSLVIVRTWTASTDTETNDCSQRIDVARTNSVPPVLCGCPPDKIVTCLTRLPDPAKVTAEDDLDGRVPVQFAETQSNPGTSCSNLITRTWTATDQCGNTSTCTQRILVQDRIRPILMCPPNLTLDVADPTDPSATGLAMARDNCTAEADLVIVHSDRLAAGDTADTLVITRTWEATDACGNRSVCRQWITVTNAEPPAISWSPDKVVECGSDWDFDEPIVRSDCSNATVQIAATVTNVTVTAPWIWEAKRTWEVADACGQNETNTQTVAVIDTAPPEIDCPPDMIMSCETCDITTNNTGVATATDLCGDVTIEYQDVSVGACPLAVIRTWTATDESGNKVSCAQKITCISGNLVTSSSLCTFDRDTATPEREFRLLFRGGGNGKKSSGFKIPSTNPGQFFHNFFYSGAVGEEVTFLVCVPYPFITKGANPIHAYDWADVQVGCDGSVCLEPGGCGVPVRCEPVTLYDHTPRAFGGEACLMLTLEVPDSGFLFVTMHLDYGLKKTTGYKAGPNGDALSVYSGAVRIPNHYDHLFTLSVDDGSGMVEYTDSIRNENDLKQGGDDSDKPNSGKVCLISRPD